MATLIIYYGIYIKMKQPAIKLIFKKNSLM